MLRRLVSRDGTLFGDPDDMYGWRDSSVFFAGLYREQEPAMYGWTGWMGRSLKTRILMTFGQRLAIELPLDAYMRVWGEIISLSL